MCFHYSKFIFFTGGFIMPGRKPVKERIALIDEKIAKKQAELKRLEAQKEELLYPVTMRAVLTKAKQAGLSPKEVAEKLGIEI